MTHKLTILLTLKARVRAECYNDPTLMSGYTPYLDTYLEPIPTPEYECGKVFPDREITNKELKHSFAPGEIVESKNGDTRYEIISATEQNGTLSGQFFMIMDCWSGAKILCDFWDTKINTDNVIITTRYRSEDIPGFVADPEEIKQYVHELVNNVHMAATDNKIRDTILINQKFDYLYAENGRLKAVVVDKNGEPQVTDVTPDKPYSQSLITDGQGDTLVVSKKGQVMGVKEYKFAGDDRHLLNEYHRQLDSLGEWQINFKKYDAQTYAFDQLGSGNHGIFATDEYYPKSGSYDFRYKSVECGKSDRIVVDFGSYPEKDSVIFKDKYGVKLKVVDGNILSFTGVSQPDTNYIYAYRGDKKIGKLFLNTYQQKTYKVVLVRVNKAAKKLDIDKVNEVLNKVYNQCAVKFEIATDTITIKDLHQFSHGGSGVLTVYNDDQKKVLSAYEKEKKMEDGVFYLFFIDNVTDKKDGNGTPVSGYMPRGYNAGFIYDGGSPHTIAHELGHGIAGLEHVFENSNNSGKTANLMDYSFAKNAEELWHFQWDQIQDPSRVWMKWSKDESEGEIRFFPNEDCKTVYFLFSAYDSQILRYYLEQGDRETAKKYLKDWRRTTFTKPEYSKNLYNGLASNVDDEAYNNNLSIFKERVKDWIFVGQQYINPNGTRDATAVYYVWGFSNASSLEELRNHNFAVIYEPYYMDRLVIPYDDKLKYDNRQKENEKHQETVLRWIQKNIGVFMVDRAITIQGGLHTAVGGQATAKVGLAFDLFGNIGIYGDQSAFLYLAGVFGIHTESFRDAPDKDLIKWIKRGEISRWIFDGSIGVYDNLYWQFRMNNVKDVYGVGSTSTISLSFEALTADFSLCWDKDDNFLGIGQGRGISAGSPFGFSHTKGVNRGLILTLGEWVTLVGKIRNVEFDFSKFDVGFDINDIVENGIKRTVLQIIGGPITVNTGIEMEKNDAPQTNPDNRYYYISKAANKNYSDSNILTE